MTIFSAWAGVLKKRRVAQERCALKRAAFGTAVTAVPVEKLVFLDECGFALNLHRRSGWVVGGGRCIATVPLQRGQNRSVLGAFALPLTAVSTPPNGLRANGLRANGLRALWQKLGAINREDFEGFLRDHLLPVLVPGSGLGLDNARLHHGGQLAALVATAGCALLYLPPYSPDFSPIELAWSWIKNQVRLMTPRHDGDRMQAIQDAADALPAQAVPGWFRKCGFGLT